MHSGAAWLGIRKVGRMKLATFRQDGRTHIGAETSRGGLISLEVAAAARRGGVPHHWPRDMLGLIEGGAELLAEVREVLSWAEKNMSAVELIGNEKVEWL